MKLSLDTTARTLTLEGHPDGSEPRKLDLYSREAFEAISHAWLKVGWNQKYPYCFSWFGRPVIQIPEDLIRTQEVIYALKPTLIIETGVAHGGSLIFYASLLKGMGTAGHIIGVDVEIRPHNRNSIEAHELAGMITLIEGDSVAQSTVERVREQQTRAVAGPVLVILDSCHTKDHVRRELEAYAPFVTPGSFIVATDGSMQWLHDVPRGEPEWRDDHPSAAAIQFSKIHPEFELVVPEWPFNESELRENITHWPGAWLRRRSDP